MRILVQMTENDIHSNGFLGFLELNASNAISASFISVFFRVSSSKRVEVQLSFAIRIDELNAKNCRDWAGCCHAAWCWCVHASLSHYLDVGNGTAWYFVLH